jgi:hypothetical protein
MDLPLQPRMIFAQRNQVLLQLPGDAFELVLLAEQTLPRQDGTGPSWPESYTGGASALLVYRQDANRGL